MLNVTLEEIMSEHIVTIDEKTTVGEAAHLLLRYQINGVLVVGKKNRNKVLGILTTTDLIKFLDKAFSTKRGRLAELNKMAGLPALGIASRRLVKIQKDTRISKVIAIMQKKKVYTVPVFDKERLVGVVGRHDILNVAFNS